MHELMCLQLKWNILSHNISNIWNHLVLSNVWVKNQNACQCHAFRNKSYYCENERHALLSYIIRNCVDVKTLLKNIRCFLTLVDGSKVRMLKTCSQSVTCKTGRGVCVWGIWHNSVTNLHEHKRQEEVDTFPVHINE